MPAHLQIKIAIMQLKQTFLLLPLICFLNLSAQQQKFISTKGKEIIGVDGKPFLIRGTNLGNWLVPEGYMFKFNKTSSAKLINESFNQLIGPAATRAFWKKYLNNILPKQIFITSKVQASIPFVYLLITAYLPMKIIWAEKVKPVVLHYWIM